MKVKITPISGSSQIVEFNTCLSSKANLAVAPVSTLSINQRWAEVINTGSSTSPSYMQLTKLDLILTIQYTDCKGNSQVETHTSSTIISTSATSTTTTTISMVPTKALDIIIPCNVEIADQQIIGQLPTTGSGNCAYSVFEIQQTAAA